MKRFTDTNIWNDPWFYSLPFEYKMAWFFIKDNCDNAGVWKWFPDALNFFTGKKITIEGFKEYFKKRIFFLSDEKIFIVKFIEFQFGNIWEGGSKIHQSVVKALYSHGIDRDRYDEIIKSVNGIGMGSQWDSDGIKNNPDGIAMGIYTHQDKEKDKDKDKIKDKEKERVVDPAVNPLRKYIIEKCPNIGRMKTQLTNQEAEKLLSRFNSDLIYKKIIAMENYVGIEKKYKSVYLTLVQWCNMAIEKGEAVQKGLNSKAGEIDQLVSLYFATLNSYKDRDPDQIISSLKLSESEERKLRKAVGL